jgi:hypothetical protein
LLGGQQQRGKTQLGLRVSQQGKCIDRFDGVAGTIMARDYKGFGNQSMTGVLEVNDK